MDVRKEKINELLKSLEIHEEERNIYITLLERGDLTTLQLSRYASISRTQVYRLLDRMKQRGLVEEIIDTHTVKGRAVGIDGLERLVKEQEEKTKIMSMLLPEIASFLSGKAGLREENTKVLYFRGKEGIKHMVWNVLQAKDECLGYTSVDVDDVLGRELAEDWRREVVRKKIHFRDITSNTEVLKHSSDTRITGYLGLAQTRYISPKLLTIDHQVDMYNNVIALYSWKEGDIFGVEIHNTTIVSLQKQIFDLTWQIAKRKVK